MNITRVIQPSGTMTCVRLDNDAVGVRSLARALRRLPGVSDLRVQNGWPLTRDDAIHFTVGGQAFVVETPFSEFCIQPTSLECPGELFEQVASHLERTRVGWLSRLF
jgi:hypothetical protein